MEEKTMEIFLDDLVPEKQKEVLRFLGMETPEEWNLDTFPLAVITAAGVEELNDDTQGGPDNVQSENI